MRFSIKINTFHSFSVTKKAVEKGENSMKISERATLIALAAKELEEAVELYESAENDTTLRNKPYPITYGDRSGLSREAIQRRILSLRTELRDLASDIK